MASLVSPITIRHPRSAEEYRAACKLVALVYQGRGYAHFLRPEDNRPDVLFVAERESQIIGSVGITLRHPGKELPIEWFFNFSTEARRPDFDAAGHFEVSKLACINSTPASEGLIVAMHRYAVAHGLPLGFACMKPALARRLGDMGIRVEHYADIRVFPPRVPPDYHGYFLEEPRPVAVSVDMPAHTALMNRLARSLERSHGVLVDIESSPAVSLALCAAVAREAMIPGAVVGRRPTGWGA